MPEITGVINAFGCEKIVFDVNLCEKIFSEKFTI